MRPGARSDPEHFDGGASLLHGGLTIFGRRQLEMQTKDGWQEPIWQKPCDFYIGNLCAPLHRVVHPKKPEAEPLFREEAGDAGILVTVMLRTDVFGSARARCSAGRPSPVDVYDVVNSLVARRLAKRPLRMPTFAECVKCMPRAPRDDNVDQLGAPSAAASAAIGSPT